MLDLTGDGLGIERGAFFVALAVGPQENVLAPVDQDAGFGFVSRRNQIDRRYREHGGKQRRNDDPAPLAHQRLAQQAQIDIARSKRGGHGDRLDDWRRLRDGPLDRRLVLARTPERKTHRLTPADATTLTRTCPTRAITLH